MQRIVFTQGGCKMEYLYPFSLTRKVQDFRIGALTIREKWERCLKLNSFDLAGECVLPDDGRQINWNDLDEKAQVYLIQCNILPTVDLLKLVEKLKPGEAVISEKNETLVRLITKKDINKRGKLVKPINVFTVEKVPQAQYFPQLIVLNKDALLFDINLLTKGKRFKKIDKSNSVTSPEKVFIEKGANVKHVFINADEGPVFIAKDALVMEGSCLRGPIYIGEKSVVKMGAKIYGATAIGSNCTVGGEIKNSIFFANSNKAHDGYLGDSVIGEWCNFGAGTSCSNMKNNIGDIDYNFYDTYFAMGKKAGVMMGDFSRTAINTSINTGTIVGVCAHVFGDGLTPKYIPDFSWGFESFWEVEDPLLSKLRNDTAVDKKIKKYKFADYNFEKALSDADAWKQLKGEKLSDLEIEILTKLYNKR